MSEERTYTKAQAQQKPLIGSSPKSNLLQRTCACGQHTIAGSECSTCRSEQSTLLRSQRTSGSPSTSTLALENAPSVNSSSGGASPFGYDFSRIPVHSSHLPMFQTKLKINQPGDVYEQEADQVAEQVMHMTNPGATLSNEEDEGKNLLMRKQSAKPGANATSTSPDVPPIVHAVLNSSGQPLDTMTRTFMEPRFGHDFSRVRVHTDDTAAEAARTLHANAFTTGSHIVFREGQFAPDTSNGRRLLAHELTHVVQQTAAGLHITGLIQRDKATEEKVKGVTSPNVQLREGAVEEAEGQRNKRIAKRKAEIQAMLDESQSSSEEAESHFNKLIAKREAEIQAMLDKSGSDPKSQSSQNRAKALKKDLDKDLETIIKEPDSRFVNKALRKDIIDSDRSVKSQELKLKGAKEQWSKFDPIFAGKEVAAALGKDSLGAHELKALVAQESGDLTEKDTKGDIAGIAQLGTTEEKRAGGSPGDRKVPEKAIVLAAKNISLVAGDLDKLLSVKPTGDERKKFIMAAYNSGANAIATAQREAIKMGRDGTNWQSLIEGEKESPLYKAILATYPKKTDYAATYKEKSEYPDKVFKRLP